MDDLAFIGLGLTASLVLVFGMALTSETTQKTMDSLYRDICDVFNPTKPPVVDGSTSRVEEQSKALKSTRSTALALRMKADAEVRQKLENDKKHKYFEAFLTNMGYALKLIHLGKGITLATAIRRLQNGFHVFTMYQHDARRACALAGGAFPEWEGRHNIGPNSYDHYHLYKHKTGSHCWYLISS